jgi:5-methylthioadenosine/S-adenosylhomocysteine deaminase
MDFLIEHGFVITMREPRPRVLLDGAVVIEDGEIAAVGKTHEIKKTYSPETRIDARGKAVLPGLIDAHVHTGICLLRGLVQDTEHWLQKGISRFKPLLTPHAVQAGSFLNAVEAVKMGTTTLCDFSEGMSDLCPQYQKLGIRAQVCETIHELPPTISQLTPREQYPFDPREGKERLRRALSLMNNWQGKGTITCVFGPQAADMCSEELLLRIKEHAVQYRTKIHMHVAQGDREINQMELRYGKRTIPFLQDIGYLDEYLLAVHLTEATDQETRLMASQETGMLFCPTSIALIDGLVPPVLTFMEAGGHVALGSDQAPGNNCTAMWNEMKMAALVCKIKRKTPTVMPAWRALRLTTVEAAHTIGLPHVGSLTPGSRADVIVVDLKAPQLSPIITHPRCNIIPNLVYAARGCEVETVIIDGKLIMEQRRLTTVHEEKIVESAQNHANSIFDHMASDPGWVEDML